MDRFDRCGFGGLGAAEPASPLARNRGGMAPWAADGATCDETRRSSAPFTVRIATRAETTRGAMPFSPGIATRGDWGGRAAPSKWPGGRPAPPMATRTAKGDERRRAREDRSRRKSRPANSVGPRKPTPAKGRSPSPYCPTHGRNRLSARCTRSGNAPWVACSKKASTRSGLIPAATTCCRRRRLRR